EPWEFLGVGRWELIGSWELGRWELKRAGRREAARLITLPVEAEYELDRPAGVRPVQRRHLIPGQRRVADAANRDEVRVVERVQHLRRELEVGVTHHLRALRDADVVLLEERSGDDQVARAARAGPVLDLDAVGTVRRREVAAGRDGAGVAARRRRAHV